MEVLEELHKHDFESFPKHLICSAPFDKTAATPILLRMQRETSEMHQEYTFFKDNVVELSVCMCSYFENHGFVYSV